MNDCIAKLLERKGRSVETVTRFTSVACAVEQMNARRIGSVVVVEGARPVGIFTERDVLVRVVGRGFESRLTLVADVMTPEPITVSSRTTVGEAMTIVTVQRCRHLPVVDAGELLGLISAGDLTSWVVRAQERTIHDLHDYIRAA